MLTHGARLGGVNGLARTVESYSLGLTVTFSAMDRFALREREAMQTPNIRSGQAQVQTIAREPETQFNQALAALKGARRIAQSTPIAVSSARAALQQASARYQSGLAPIDDVAQAQRLLAQAQIDDALARLSVWRARFQVETARGNIQPFLAEASQ
jgi:outer membrane protein